MSDLVTVIAMFLPLVLILWLGSFADRQRQRGQKDSGVVLAIVTYVLLVGLYLTLFVLGVLAHVAGAALHGQLPADLAESYRRMGIDPTSIATALPGVGLGMWLPALLGMTLLLRPVRRLCARLIPIDAERTVHAVALSFPMLILTNLMVTVAIGLRNLASMIQSNAAQGVELNVMSTTWVQEALFVLMALVGVGWLSRRGLRETLHRLGINRPSVRQVAIGLGIGLLLVPLVLLLEYLASLIGFGENVDVSKLAEQLTGQLMKSVPGILTLGLAAGLGEESLFRGALQPRFGLILTAALFALLHSNYGISLATFIVFVLGLVLGLVRMRFNTTTSMITHAVYNMSLGLIALLNIVPNF